MEALYLYHGPCDIPQRRLAGAARYFINGVAVQWQGKVSCNTGAK